MKNYDSSLNDVIKKIYGNDNIVKPSPYKYPKKKLNFKKNYLPRVGGIFFKITQIIRERISFEDVKKEMVFSFLLISLFLYLVLSGAVVGSNAFGQITLGFIVFSVLFNFFKASIYSLLPGLISISIYFFMKNSSLVHEKFLFLSSDKIDYILLIGGIYLSLSMLGFKKNNSKLQG